MNADVYQSMAMAFSVEHDTPELRLINAAIGLMGEAGEVAALLHAKVQGDPLIARYLTLAMTVGLLGEHIKKARFHGHDADYGFMDETVQAIERLAERVGAAIGHEAMTTAPDMAAVSLDQVTVSAAVKEISDVLWYSAQGLDALNTPMSVAMLKNIEKLQKRYGAKGFSTEASKNRAE